MECMANSDNVLRAGLTPKPRDVPNLLASLSHISGDPIRHAIQPVPFYAEEITARLASTVLYKPPTPEFSVLCAVVTPGCVETHRAIRGPSIVVVLGGQGIIRWEMRWQAPNELTHAIIDFHLALIPHRFLCKLARHPEHREDCERRASAEHRVQNP
jgi:mannose-6-phosphate isomerase class I